MDHIINNNNNFSIYFYSFFVYCNLLFKCNSVHSLIFLSLTFVMNVLIYVSLMFSKCMLYACFDELNKSILFKL